MRPTKVLVVGNTSFTHSCLEALPKSNFQVVALLQLKQSSVSDLDYLDLQIFCAYRSIPYKKVSSLSSLEAREFIDYHSCQAVLFIGHSNPVPLDYFLKYGQKTIFFYEGLFPDCYGNSPLSWSILNNLSETGLTFYRTQPTPSSSQVLFQQKISISVEDDAESLSQLIYSLASSSFLTLRKTIHLNYPSFQNVDFSSIKKFWGVLTNQDCQIKWDQPSDRILRLIKAVTRPFSGAWFQNDNQKVVAWKAKVGKFSSSKPPGTLIYQDHNFYVVSTLDFDLAITDFDIITI